MILATLVAFIYGASREQEVDINDDFQRIAQTARLNYDFALKAEVKILSSALEFLQHDKLLRQSLTDRDKKKAFQYALPIFESLRSQYLITHFYLLTPQREVLLRVHEPHRDGDIINRFTALQAETTGKPASGIELGTLGTFTLRVVYPLYDANGLIGYLELGEEIEHVIEKIIDSSDIDIAIAIDKHYLVRNDWEQGMQMLGNDVNWDNLLSFVSTYASMKIPVTIMETVLHYSSGQANDHQSIIDNRYFFVRSYPLVDAGSQDVGKLLVLRDMSNRVKINQRAIIQFSAFAFILGLFILAFFYMLAGRIERKLEDSRLKLIEESNTRELMQQDHINELKTNQHQLLEAHAQLIHAKDQAETANRAKSQFLSTMSHELRTPLNIILGFAQVLEIDSRSRQDDDSVKHILLAGRQLLGMVDNLLNFSSIDINHLQLNIQPLSIADIVSDCVNQISTSVVNRYNISIENLVTDAAILVRADDHRLRQVLIHLLNNAQQYNKENGRIIISAVLHHQDYLRIEVSDTGQGIPADKLSLLFIPFERLDHQHGSISGVGIGLYIVKQLVEAMHGTVGVESVQGQGSTFWFELPLN